MYTPVMNACMPQGTKAQDLGTPRAEPSFAAVYNASHSSHKGNGLATVGWPREIPTAYEGSRHVMSTSDFGVEVQKGPFSGNFRATRALGGAIFSAEPTIGGWVVGDTRKGFTAAGRAGELQSSSG